ncbi:hypothetical protein NDN08_003564 [Rhodosorus marinus]|uniref:ATP phosphoribosyltransferase n=1 Tax=Rhodosorus marinus TaxID=101924 RepID=A0AAV8V0K1_9RHOD|nr:hypothetical protein NDN08_003564 [Rhodosorus marinus]
MGMGLGFLQVVTDVRFSASRERVRICLGPNGFGDAISREKIRIAVPSKGGILDDTKDLLRDIGAELRISNPRQYTAALKGFEDVEVWLQRPPDIARKVRDGTVELGFTGYDLVVEHGGESNEIVPVHEDLGYGQCRLAVGVPMNWGDITGMEDLSKHLKANSERPLRVASKYSAQTKKFFARSGIRNYQIVYMDGALEASTQMGTADCIVDLVSSGVTLRENLLKEIEGGTLLTSTMQLIGNRSALTRQDERGTRLRILARELMERIEAHNVGSDQCNLIANVRGSSPGDVARRLGAGTDLRGMDGPTISTVIPPRGSDLGMYAVGLIIPKERMYNAVEQLRRIGGSGVCVLPVTYVFEKSSDRWKSFISELGIRDDTDAVL